MVRGDSTGDAVGKRIILPATFTGGPRYMYQNYQDAMAICRWYKNPHLFITFTANPKWPEVDSMLSLIEGQKAEDRPDIIARVFKLKLKQLMKCLKEDHYFGQDVADVYTVEFQKRGLPHAHILLWLLENGIELTPQYIDSIIQAEIPDKELYPELYAAVSRYMAHGPCGNANPNCPCMIDNKCSKNFPKSFNEVTTIDGNGHPVYRRREDGRFINKGDHLLDNRSIVPYNAGLLLMFDAHINVEWCNTARAIKYLFKYICKGPDRTTMIMKDDVDEIKSYLDCRYISACEAAWRIFEFEIQERSPAVIRLPVHLEGEQAVVLRDNDALSMVVNKEDVNETMLTEWMNTNAIDDQARSLTYAQFPTEYVWTTTNEVDEVGNKKKSKGWTRRKQGKSIGRIAYVHPTAGERYYLRLLLNIVKGPTSFQEIRTIDGHVHPSYKEVCYVLGLLSNDKEWHDAIQEANQWAMPSQLRELFVTILLFCEVTNVLTLWECSFKCLSEDIERMKRRLFKHPTLILSEEQTRTYTLIEIDRILVKFGKSLADFKEMPKPNYSEAEYQNRLIAEERIYDTKQLTEEWTNRVKKLNTEQLAIYDRVVHVVSNETGETFFVYGHGGTGKTFLYSTTSARLRSEQKIVLNVASSGIAALLLPGGRTDHSRFEIPIYLLDNSTCNVRRNTQLAELLHHTSLIIWDEAPMDHRFAFEALDRTMRDIAGYNNPEEASKLFGGKVVLLGGDYRQVLPIVPKGGRQDVVQASINRSHVWNECKVFTLKQSMRVQEGDYGTETYRKNKWFNQWLLAMGDGRLEAQREDHEAEDTWIKIPNEYIADVKVTDLDRVVETTYPDFELRRSDDNYLRERAILTPLNETADTINEYMMSLLTVPEHIYKSSDEICLSSTEGDHQYTAYPTKYLNTLNLSDLPHHELKLKEGMPVMLLRNINPSQGLCNGTRLIIIHLGKFVIEGKIITGSKQGNKILIPRIVMTSSDIKLPFILKRRQYPLKPCYAMTINKSQGQSLSYVGVYLPKPVFSHGQLYVAASRTTSLEGLKFFIDDSSQKYKGHTRNIVYMEVFSNLPTVF